MKWLAQVQPPPPTPPLPSCSQPHSSEQLMAALHGLEAVVAEHGVRLVVIDSVAAVARIEFGGAGMVSGMVSGTQVEAEGLAAGSSAAVVLWALCHLPRSVLLPLVLLL